MIAGRPAAATPGKTRTCPHCKATILATASICPACRHHLQFNRSGEQNTVPSFSALKVDGAIRGSEISGPLEYSMVLSIRNERGEEVTRQVVGVGALQPAEQRTFSLSVEVFGAAKGINLK